MQNIDYYERKNVRAAPPHMDDFDPEYFSQLTQNMPREGDRKRKKASRAFFLISSLCIISFTVGIVIGIKFVGGTQREIVDKKTFNAVTDIGKKFSTIITDKSTEPPSRENYFPKKSYPYVLKIRSDYDYATSRKIADFLSRKGHTIILTKYDSSYRVYIGPYKSSGDADAALKKISGYQKYSLAENLHIIKR